MSERNIVKKCNCPGGGLIGAAGKRPAPPAYGERVHPLKSLLLSSALARPPLSITSGMQKGDFLRQHRCVALGRIDSSAVIHGHGWVSPARDPARAHSAEVPAAIPITLLYRHKPAMSDSSTVSSVATSFKLQADRRSHLLKF